MDIYLNGEVGWELTLDSVITKFDGKKVENVYINSIGGDVWEGLAIYNYLKEKDVNTITNGVVASIASIIFLAGKNRTVNQFDDFLIHLPFSMGMGNSEDLQKSADELKKIENKLAKIYETETNLTFEQAIEEMSKDSFTTPEWLKENGFVNEIKEFKAVAIINNKKMKEVGLKKEDKTFIQNAVDSIKNLLSPKSKVVQDANGSEIDFYELEADATPAVGDKARIDDKPAEGDIKLPSGETYVFAGGELTEIKEDEMEASTEEVETLKQEVQAKETELAEVQAKLESSEKKQLEIDAKLKEVSDKFEKFQDDLKTKFNWDGNIQKNENKVQLLK